MLKEKLDALKENFQNKTDGNNKKKIENLIVFIIILIITIFVINYIWKGSSNISKQNDEATTDKVLASTDKVLDAAGETANTSKQSNTSKNELETKLENILSKMNGVGKVQVLITYSETSKTIAMYDEDSSTSTTQEADKSGGTRNILESSTKKSVIYKDVDGEKEPVTQSVVQPTIEGAIITAKGANNANIKTNIITAVEAVTGLATHKIQVFEMQE